MTLDWATSSSKHLMIALLVTIGCGDDGGTAEDGPGSTSAATTMNGSASGSGSAGTSEGGTAAATSTGNGTGDASLGTTAADDTAGATTDGATTNGTTTNGTTTDGTTGGGVEVGSCDECSAEELCMQLTEYAGPADGGGPDVTLYCFAYPAACGEALDCRCAGHLCPVPEGGSEAWCETGDGILYCSVAYP
jgi:hypothetical protein